VQQFITKPWNIWNPIDYDRGIWNSQNFVICLATLVVKHIAPLANVSAFQDLQRTLLARQAELRWAYEFPLDGRISPTSIMIDEPAPGFRRWLFRALLPPIDIMTVYSRNTKIKDLRLQFPMLRDVLPEDDYGDQWKRRRAATHEGSILI
jgi:hypothetical protein